MWSWCLRTAQSSTQRGGSGGNAGPGPGPEEKYEFVKETWMVQAQESEGSVLSRVPGERDLGGGWSKGPKTTKKPTRKSNQEVYWVFQLGGP